ncbi:hypothetical protein EDD22DRAFT_961597 [Suillus occidentalis]|nr:hypothetical protein EDD22DRAFT_961597 [Suillus occidentalis]
MNMNSASSSATVVEESLVNHYVSTSAQTTRTPVQLAAIYKENIEAADEAALIESAILSRQHALEIERILVARNAYPTAAVLNTIRTAQLIEQEAQLIVDPAVKQSILHYQKRIRGLCYLLLPSDIKKDIREAILVILERTTTEVARPPSPHCLDEYIRIPSSPLSEVPKPVPPPATPRIAANDPATISMPNLELGTQAAPISVEDFSPPPSPNTRVARREQKRRLRISSKSASPVKRSTKASPTHRYLTNPSPLPTTTTSSVQQPGHLSIYCKKLKEKQTREKIREPPTTAFENPDFYTHMKIWEAHVDEDVARAYEKERDEALNEFEEHYQFDDDPINYANQDD